MALSLRSKPLSLNSKMRRHERSLDDTLVDGEKDEILDEFVASFIDAAVGQE